MKEQYKAWGEYQTKAQIVAKISYAFDKVEDLLSSMRLLIEVKGIILLYIWQSHKCNLNFRHQLCMGMWLHVADSYLTRTLRLVLTTGGQFIEMAPNNWLFSSQFFEIYNYDPQKSKKPVLKKPQAGRGETKPHHILSKEYYKGRTMFQRMGSPLRPKMFLCI